MSDAGAIVELPDLGPSALNRWWPAPTEPAPPVVRWTAGAAGLVAAATVPPQRPGLGWLLAGLGATVAVAAAARGLGFRPVRRLWALAALALLAIGTVRASEWLFALAVPTACVAASLAVTRGRSVPALVLGAVAVPLAALRAMPWAGRALGARRRDATGSPPRLARSVLVAVVLVVVFGALFAGADAQFAHLLEAALPTVDGATVWRWMVLFGVLGAGTLGACYVRLAPPPAPQLPTRSPKPLRRLDWTLPVTLLVALFAVFVAVQIAALFGGPDHVRRTTGLTFAEYARSGFWQLSVVTVLTLGVIGVAVRLAPKETAADRAVLRALLGSLSVLTLVIVASALTRMWAYQEAYGFTVLRVLVAACELWLGAMYLMIIVAGARLRARWLPMALVSTAVVALLALAALDPERFIAERNVDRYERTGRIDLGYLATLSADAAPALARLPEPLRSCALTAAAAQLDDDDGWRGWNLSRAAARGQLALYMPKRVYC
jgi:hypothetical protein